MHWKASRVTMWTKPQVSTSSSVLSKNRCVRLLPTPVKKVLLLCRKYAKARQTSVTMPITNVPNRWRYPNTEVNDNPYYKEVSAEDTYYHKLFWAK